MASGRFRASLTVRRVLGLLLGVAVVAVVLGRAYGVIGGTTESGSGGSAGLESTAAESATGDSPSGSPESTAGPTAGPTTGPTTSPTTSPADGPTTGSPTASSPGPGRRGGAGDRPRGQVDDPAGDAASDPDLLRRVEELLEGSQALPPARFRVSTLNVLGASHTTPRGSKPSYAPGATRIGWIAELLDRLAIDVVGLQEYEMVQHQAFLRRTGETWGVYPGAALGTGPIRNSIAWKRDTWRAVRTQTIPIPYFGGKRVRMPYVLLEHVESGRRVWFVNIHNPVSSRRHGDNERWRDLGTSLQIGLVQRLNARTGHPVILMGDFNERDEAFCTVTRRTPAVAANGGTPGPPCTPPQPVGIDWIFGTEDVAFSQFRRLREGLVSRATDHPVVVATAEVAAEPGS